MKKSGRCNVHLADNLGLRGKIPSGYESETIYSYVINTRLGDSSGFALRYNYSVEDIVREALYGWIFLSNK